mgnify:CR=1 FL=1
MSEWSWNDNSTQGPLITGEKSEASCSDPNTSTSPPNQISSPEPVLRRSQRERRPPGYLQDYQCSNAVNFALFAGEPTKYEEAAKENAWVKAMDEEIRMIEKNKTWKLVDKPQNKEIIGLKWVYKVKYNEDGSIQKYKARLVAKGYSQQPGVDFNETFAPVVRMETIRTVLALAAQLKLPVY